MTSLPVFTREHVLAAVRQIRRDGVPRARASRGFCLPIDGAHFPPKYVLARAAQAAVGRALRPDEFSGGAQTNSILEGLGFPVVSCDCGALIPPATSSDSGPRTLVATGQQVTPTQGREAPASIVRLVMRGQTPADAQAGERILLDAFGSRWPKGTAAKFVITPGGFARCDFPRSWSGATGWARSCDLGILLSEAEKHLSRVVTKRVLHAASARTRVLTIGIDMLGGRDARHVELVAVYDVARRRLVRWTGKSYPTLSQESDLVQVTDLDTHLIEIAGERVLVLGCHDLNMFSPRGRANQAPEGVRRKRCDDMRRKVSRFAPTVVLQHPHSTDTPNIWRMPWLSLAREVPSIAVWASGLAYYSWNGQERAKLERVQAQTRSNEGDVIDIVMRSDAFA